MRKIQNNVLLDHEDSALRHVFVALRFREASTSERRLRRRRTLAHSSPTYVAIYAFVQYSHDIVESINNM